MKLRPIKIVKNYLKHAEGSCMISMGNTTVLCVASVEDKIPSFIEKQGLDHGWVTAEYAFMPRAGKQRTPRQKGTSGGRSQEISRLIGRSLRSVVDMKKLGRRSIILDCDVISADGGTRTASINGAYVALFIALKNLYTKKIIDSWPLTGSIGAVSVGIVNGEMILDLKASEDNNADVDMNVVMSNDGRVVEIQGTAEKKSFSRSDMDKLVDMASKGIQSIIQYENKLLGKINERNSNRNRK